MEQPTVKKIAALLNVSVSTVSKAFKDSHEISASTKKKIMNLARELNYQPNPFASGLRTRRSKTIAVVIPEIANSFFYQAINGIEKIASEKGYHVLIYITHEDYSKEVSFLRLLQNGRVDGIIMSITDGTRKTHLEGLFEKDIPVVFFDRVPEKVEAVSITTNDFESGYKATQHLIEQGCKQIAHLYYAKNLSIANRRMEGYLQALKDYDHPLIDALLVACSNEPEVDDATIKKLFISKSPPDGVFSSFERLALHAYKACESVGLLIPEQVKVISFSNLEAANFLNPSLTAITQPAFEMGKVAATALFDFLKAKTYKPKTEYITLPSLFVPRNSTHSKENL